MSRGRALGPGKLWKRLRTDGRSFWMLDWRDEHGRRRRKALSTDKRTAERIRSEIIHRRDLAVAGLGAEAGQELMLEKLQETYLEDLHPRVTSMHFKNVSQRLRDVVGQLGGTRVRDLKSMTAVRLRNRAVANGKSHRTANLLIDRLQTMLRWAEANELIAHNPLAQLKRLPDGGEHCKYKRRALSDEEIESFLRAAEEDDERNELEAGLAGCVRVPQVPLWETLLGTGIRYGEARQLRWGDVDLQRKLLVVRAESAKSRKQRIIPLRDDLVETLKSLRVVHEEVYGRLPTVNCHVFLSPEGVPWPVPSTNPARILYRVFERAGIPRTDLQGFKLDLHALRTTCASRMARSGVPLVMAQRILGHSSIELTAKAYTHLDVEDLRAAVNGLPELSPSPASNAKEAAE